MEPAADLLADPAAEHGEYFADGHRFGRFAIREFLGATGASAAYRAREMGAAREAVLKVYTPRFSGVPGLANYVRTVAQRDHADLAHPNLAQFFRAGVSASRIFIARAYTAGGSAQDRLNAGESFSVPEVLAIVRDLAQALHYLHARGVVHRNIKPSNILFGDDGRAMLADAGLRPLLEAANQTYLASGVLLQSRAYQAQEQLAAKGATPQSDIFSLAASLYTLLTRMPPFEAEEPRALLEEQLVGAPPSARRHVPAVPAEMDALLQRAMDFAPGRRPQSIKAFATELGIEIGAPAAVAPVVETEGPGNEEKIAIRGRPPKKLPERAHAPRVRIGDQFARLTIRSRIAFTPIATIFRASDSADKRQVVFKILGPEFERLPQFADYFRKVVQRFAPVQHPRLVRLLGGGRSRGYLYYAVPYLAGGTLADRLADGPLEPDAALDILRDIAAALSHLHQEGIVHRDIKPSNIHFDAEGHALLGEVGVGPMLRAAASTFVQPAQLGPIAYRSPEQLAGRRKGSALDGRSDVYALGVLLFEALTGRPPYEAESAADLAMLQFTSPVPSARALRPPELSPLDPQLDDVLRIALSYSPKGRFASIAELMTAVTGALPIDLPASDVISVEPVSDVLPAAEAPSAAVRPAMGVQELLDLDVAPRPAPSPADLLMVDALELAPEAAAPAAAPIPAPGPAAVPAPVPRPRPTLAIVAATALLGIMGIGAALAFAGPVVRGILRPQSSANIPTLVSAAAADTGNNGATAIPPTAGAASTVGQPTAAGDLGATGGGVSGGVVAVQTQTPSTESAGASATFVADAATVAIGASPTSQPAQPTSTQPPTSTPTPADTLTVVPTLALTETPTPTATPTLTASPTPTLGPAAGEDPAMAQAELEIVSLTNQQRAANGVAPALAAQVDVMSVAQGRSDDMQARDYFAHSDPVTGSIPAFDQLAGYGAVGENLFIISGSVPVDELPGHAISSWMSSTGHRANILDPVYAFIGVGVQFDDSCPTFGECWLVTQLFTSQVP